MGDAGKKIHLGRSHNDQVILALRLYLLNAVLTLGKDTTVLAQAFIEFARTNTAEQALKLQANWFQANREHLKVNCASLLAHEGISDP